MDANGSQPWGVNLPIENGYINVANGDIHLEIPLGYHPQRGEATINESIVYDSRFWHIQQSGSSYSWQPSGIPGPINGWRIPLAADGVQAVLQATNSNCDVGITWTDYTGATHQFIVPNYTTGCSQATVPAYALDGSGYVVNVALVPGSTTQRVFYICDKRGTTVYTAVLSPATYPVTYNTTQQEEHLDRNGNCPETYACGSTDTLGHTPIAISYSAVAADGSFSIFYDVLTTGGATKRYTVNVESILLTSSFHESGVSEFSNYVEAIQSIQLPDGTAYTFFYEPNYGELQEMIPPTGGYVVFYYQNFLDSYQNENRWIYSYSGEAGGYQFTPSVVTSCTGSNKTGCQEQVAVTPVDGSGNLVKYLLTLNGGAWNTQTDYYEGSTHIVSQTNNNSYGNSCPTGDSLFCANSTWLTGSTSTTTLADTGQAAVTQTSYANPQYGKVTSVKHWDYGVSTAANPSRSSLYDYTYMVNGAPFLGDDAELDGSNTQIVKDIYKYDEQAPTPIPSLPNYAGPLGNRGNLTSIASGVSSTLTKKFTYDTAGQMLSSMDPNGNTTSYGYSCSDAYLSSVTLAGNLTYQTVFDCNLGLPTEQIGLNPGETYLISYDAIGRLSSTSNPDGGGTTYTYPSATEIDQTTLQTNSVSSLIENIVDSAGRPYQTVAVAPEGEITTETTYATNGQVHCISTAHLSGTTSPTDGSTCYAYDVLGRVTQTTMPDNNITANTYVGNTITATDEMLHAKKYTYDSFQRLTSVLEPNATGALTYETDYQYNGFDELTRVDQWGGPQGSAGDRTRLLGYDDFGRLAALSVPENASSAGPALPTCPGYSGTLTNKWTNCYQYDANGNQTSATDNRSITVTSKYDGLNRATLITPSDGTPVAAYGYDGNDETGIALSPAVKNAKGRLSRSSNEVNAASNYSYDAVGRLQQQSTCVPQNCTYSIQTTAGYDLAGNMTSLTYPDGRVVVPQFDKLNRLSGLNYSAWSGTAVNTPYLSSISHAPPGQVTGAAFGNGITQSASYNPRQSVSALSYSNFAGALWSKNYVWDKTGGNLSTLTDPVSAVTRTMGYDPLNRITSAVDTTSSTASSPAVVSLSGSEKTLTRTSSSYATAILGVSGIEAVGTYYPCGEGSCPTSVYDNGTVTLLVGGTKASTSYQQGSTTASIAAALVSALHSSSVTASVSGSTITFKADSAGTAGNGIFVAGSSVSMNMGTYRNAQGGYSQLFLGPSFTTGNATLSGGALAGTTYDTGTATILINGSVVGTASYGNGSSTATLASALAASINADSSSLVNGAVSGAAVSLTCRTTCGGAVYATTAAVSNNDTADFPAGSFTTKVTQAVSVAPSSLLNQAYSYDPWGNLQESGSFNFSPLFTTSNQMSTYAYDAAGNETNDGLGHTFAFNAYGLLTSVNGTQLYTYGANGERVQKATTPATEYIYFGGQPIAMLNGSNWTDLIYGAGGLLAEVAGTQTAVPTYRVTDHLDSLGGSLDNSGNFSGALNVAPFGQTVSGSNSDHFQYTGLEFDSESGLDHATSRQYLPNQGRWLSPDAYGGSYDLGNPQSFNRYSYVGNNPLSFTDPSGMIQNVPVSCGDSCGDGGIAGIFSDIGEAIASFFGGGGPSFHGTVQPRPGSTGGPADDTNWDGSFGESLGLPTGPHAPPFRGGGIGDLLGLGGGGCEFGACGGGSSLTGVGSIAAAGTLNTGWVQPLLNFDLWFLRQTTPAHGAPWHGVWCGVGGAGTPSDYDDGRCMLHDYCYFQHGLNAGNNFDVLAPDKRAALQACNQALCNAESSSGTLTAAMISSYFHVAPEYGNGCH